MSDEPRGEATLDARPFDELVAELQAIVQRLESGGVGLEESIGLYQQGLRLHAACEARLRDAELKITELGRRGADPEPPPIAGSTDPAS